jgi:hypothetical protein
MSDTNIVSSHETLPVSTPVIETRFTVDEAVALIDRLPLDAWKAIVVEAMGNRDGGTGYSRTLTKAALRRALEAKP